jgi:hypothetical protein
MNKEVNELLGNERIGIRASEISNQYKFECTDQYVILQPVTVQDKDYFTSIALLRAIDKNVCYRLYKRNPVAAAMKH